MPASRSITLLVCLLLAGCIASPTNLVRLSQLSPLESNPANIRVAVEVPATFRLRDGDVLLRFAFDRDDGATGLDERYALSVTDTRGAAPGIGTINPATTRLFVTALTPEDARTMRLAQQTVLDWRASGIDGKGTLSVTVSGCHVTPARPTRLPVVAHIQTEPGTPFAAVMKIDDLNAVIARENLEPIGPCDDFDLGTIDPLVDD